MQGSQNLHQATLHTVNSGESAGVWEEERDVTRNLEMCDPLDADRLIPCESVYTVVTCYRLPFYLTALLERYQSWLGEYMKRGFRWGGWQRWPIALHVHCSWHLPRSSHHLWTWAEPSGLWCFLTLLNVHTHHSGTDGNARSEHPPRWALKVFLRRSWRWFCPVVLG